MAPWLELPYEITQVTSDEQKLIKKCLLGYSKRFVKCGKHGYVMPGAWKTQAEMVYNFKVRPDDVWVITFPRSGTTWTQEMVWLLENDLNYDMAKSKPLYERFPMLETTSQIPDLGFELIKADFMNLASFQGLGQAARTPSWQSMANAPSPRYIKTHLPLSMLPPNLLSTAKVIYVARDPRDVAISYYYLHKMIIKGVMKTSFKAHWEAFRRDLLPYCPVIPHANEAWEQRQHPNLHFLFYEDLIKDLPKEVKLVAQFLGRIQYNDKDIEELANYLSFDSLRKNNNVNNNVEGSKVQFIRKGEAGGWVSYFDSKMAQEAEKYLSTRLRGINLNYPSYKKKEEENIIESSYL